MLNFNRSSSSLSFLYSDGTLFYYDIGTFSKSFVFDKTRIVWLKIAHNFKRITDTNPSFRLSMKILNS